LLLQLSKEKDEGFFFCTLNDHSGTSCTAATPDAQSPRKKNCLFVQKKTIVAGLKKVMDPWDTSSPPVTLPSIFKINLDKINFILKTV